MKLVHQDGHMYEDEGNIHFIS